LAFDELKSFQETGSFLYRHPLIVRFSLRAELLDLKRRDPESFLNKFADARDNVKRYKSFLNSKTRTDEQKALDRENLKKHEGRVDIFADILKEE